MRVNFDRNAWDQKLKILNRHRFTTKVMGRVLPLTPGQISYRRRLLNGGVMSYRRGLSPKARDVILEIERLHGTLDKLKRLKGYYELELGHRQPKQARNR